MSRSAKVSIDWGDGSHDFRLRIGELEELDEKCGVGPGFALGQILAGVHGNWKAKMLREVIRLGLIGGGATPADALKLVRRYVDERPLSESITAAQLVLQACIVGVGDDAPGESAGAAKVDRPSPTAASDSPTSTEPPRPPESAPPTSATAASGRSRPRSPAGAPPTASTRKDR